MYQIAACKMSPVDAVDGSHPPASQCAKMLSHMMIRQCPEMAKSCRQPGLSITSAFTLKAAVNRNTCLRLVLTRSGHRAR
jgi:hypothetical protein